MEIRKRVDVLDNIELLSVQHQKNDFPEHFHETFCVSLIGRGTEVIKTQSGKLHTCEGKISINNPYEIHSNPILDKDVAIGFDTIYLSQALVDSLLGIENVVFENIQTSSTLQVRLFNDLKFIILNKFTHKIEPALAVFLQALDLKSNPTIFSRFTYANRFTEVLGYIETNYHNKITLETLAKIAQMDKFSFSKSFRNATGLTPINYVLMKKIFYSKSLIDKDSTLTQTAFELDFTDQSHFNRMFKRFIGISPTAYQSNL